MMNEFEIPAWELQMAAPYSTDPIPVGTVVWWMEEDGGPEIGPKMVDYCCAEVLSNLPDDSVEVDYPEMEVVIRDRARVVQPSDRNRVIKRACLCDPPRMNSDEDAAWADSQGCR